MEVYFISLFLLRLLFHALSKISLSTLMIKGISYVLFYKFYYFSFYIYDYAVPQIIFLNFILLVYTITNVLFFPPHRFAHLHPTLAPSAPPPSGQHHKLSVSMGCACIFFGWSCHLLASSPSPKLSFIYYFR